jgi:hypothetical protein
VTHSGKQIAESWHGCPDQAKQAGHGSENIGFGSHFFLPRNPSLGFRHSNSPNYFRNPTGLFIDAHLAQTGQLRQLSYLLTFYRGIFSYVATMASAQCKFPGSYAIVCAYRLIVRVDFAGVSFEGRLALTHD